MPQNITDVDTWSDPLTAPAGADERNSASVLAALQKIANRTKYLYNRFVAGPVSSTDNAIARFHLATGKVVQDSGLTITDAHELAYVAPPSRVIRIGGEEFAEQLRGTDGAGYPDEDQFVFDENGAASNGGNALAKLPQLRTGMVVTSLDFRLNPGAARVGAAQMSGALVEVSSDNTQTVYGLITDNGSSGVQTRSSAAFTCTIDRSTKRYHLVVVGGDTADVANDGLFWVDVHVTDPGPRNF
jgi:hypothetical protein